MLSNGPRAGHSANLSRVYDSVLCAHSSSLCVTHPVIVCHCVLMQVLPVPGVCRVPQGPRAQQVPPAVTARMAGPVPTVMLATPDPWDPPALQVSLAREGSDSMRLLHHVQQEWKWSEQGLLESRAGSVLATPHTDGPTSGFNHSTVLTQALSTTADVCFCCVCRRSRLQG